MARDPRRDSDRGSRLDTGDRIGPYVILEMLGSGGMGEVFRAHDERLGRDVAIKRLADSAIADDDARRRVLREARAAAALSHPNIAAVFDVLETPDGLAIVMEFVAGESLGARLARGPQPPAEALQIALQIADALTEAHDRGVIHQDLKPANVHLTPGGKAKILDFGIARTTRVPQEDAGRPDTAAGQIIGTPGYMAPEQMSGGRIDARTDIYGAGLLLFEMLTGRRAFDQPDLFARARAILGGAAPRIEDIDPSLPRHLSALVSRAMAVEPEDRFSSAREFHGALAHAARLLSDVPTIDDTDRARARSGIHWAGTRRRLRQHRMALAIAAVLIAAGALVAWRSIRDAWSPSVSAHGATLGVLPLRNGSGDARDDALALGLTEGVAARLSALRWVRVLSLDDSREAAAGGSDPTRAARALGATLVLDGALRRTGDALEVEVALVRHDGHRMPAGRYTGEASRPFALHQKVADGVTAVLDAEGLAATAASPDVAPPTTSQEAYAEYAQARLFLERPDVPGNLDHAIRLFQSAIGRDDRFAQAHAGLGQAYWALYQETNAPEWTGRATAAILDALRLDPEQPEVRMSLAVMYRGLGRADDAQAELRRVLAVQPGNDDAHRMLGGMHTDRGEWDRAVEAILKAIALRPNYWRNHAELGFAHFRAGRLGEAAAAYRRVTDLQPDSARGYHMLGTVQQSAGDTTAALESYRTANRIRPAASTLSNMGTILFWQGDYAGAAEAYEQAIGHAPSQPDLYANLGDAQRRLGRPDDAEKSYRRAVDEMQRLLSVNEQDATNLAILAMYHAKIGDRAAAGSALERALALNPDDGDVLLNGAIVHTLAGETARGCTMIDRALSRGASETIVRQTGELQALKGCAAYDRVSAMRR